VCGSLASGSDPSRRNWVSRCLPPAY
jgi:hypothetical protein